MEAGITTSESSQGDLARVRDLRVAMLGNVDSGKSTLVGVLSKGLLDDGRGLARSHVLQHRHEHEKGQTSSVAQELLGYDSSGSQVLPSKLTGKHTRDFMEVASKSSHRITLVDLCGHEKYLKTTIFGLTGLLPDCALIIIGANNGVMKMTREHLGLSVALDIPVVVVVTKIDMCPTHIFKETMGKVDRVLKLAKKKKYMVRDEESVQVASQSLFSNKIAPVFTISSLTGEGLPLLKDFLKKIAFLHATTDLGALRIRNQKESKDSVSAEGKNTAQEKSDVEETSTTSKKYGTGKQDLSQTQHELAEYMIDASYMVPGVGVVVGGALVHGTIKVGDRLLLGPDRVGAFKLVTAKSIHRQCVPTEIVYAGQQATVALKSIGKNKEPLKRSHVRKGMVLLAEKKGDEVQGLFTGQSQNEIPSSADTTASSFQLNGDVQSQLKEESKTSSSTPKKLAIREFDAEIKVLHHSTTISTGYAPIVHLGVVRQSAQIMKITGLDGKDIVLRTGVSAVVRFRFAYFAEYITVGMPLIFREGRAKGVGRVTKLY